MKANELRIGNWVLGASRGLPQQITPATLYQFDKLNVLPIFLTPEILEKAGFEKTMAWTYAIDLVGNIKLVYYLGERGVSIGFKDYSDFKCEYLHQLQNLYFALTGEELNIEL